MFLYEVECLCFNVGPTGIDNINNDSVEDASTGQYDFTFAQGTYNYEIQGFSQGDNLKFAAGTAVTINNVSGTDGAVSVTASHAASGTAVSLTLTGISPALDSTIFSLDTFNAAFGTALVLIILCLIKGQDKSLLILPFFLSKHHYSVHGVNLSKINWTP